MIAYAGQETTPGRVLPRAAQRAQQLICRARTRVSAALLLPSHAHTQQTQTIRTHIALHYTQKAQSHNNVGPVLHLTWAEQMRGQVVPVFTAGWMWRRAGLTAGPVPAPLVPATGAPLATHQPA